MLNFDLKELAYRTVCNVRGNGEVIPFTTTVLYTFDRVIPWAVRSFDEKRLINMSTKKNNVVDNILSDLYK